MTRILSALIALAMVPCAALATTGPHMVDVNTIDADCPDYDSRTGVLTCYVWTGPVEILSFQVTIK